ncbi:MAG: radical SAM protein [Prevotellaceae bacterium]|jgi:radical SAM protein with 4Fe4S-binding SPASM domain|nr:radical SAM protein [Prevotellaceae bacterium]
MMNLLLPDSNSCYILNPGYGLRDDELRWIIFSKPGWEGVGSRNWKSFIHPVHASIFSFFTHRRTLEENLQLIAAHCGYGRSKMFERVLPFIENDEEFFVTWGSNHIYFPEQVLIPLEKAGADYRFREMEPAENTGFLTNVYSRRLTTGPLQVTFMLNNRCTTQCRYCYADTQTQVRNPLSTLRILKLIDEAAALPVQQVNLMGGEVFLHPDWETILSALVERDIAPDFVSTKIPLTAVHIEKLQRTRFRHAVQVSLDAVDADILTETIAADSGYAERMKQSLLRLDESGLKYQIATVLTTANCNVDVMERMYAFLSGLKHLHDWRITPVSNSITKPYKELSHLKPGKQQAISLFDYIEEHFVPQAPFPIVLNREALEQKYRCDGGGCLLFKGHRCSALTSHFFILPDGHVSICEQLYWNPRFLIGNVKHSNLKSVWNSPQAEKLMNIPREEIQESSPCRKCDIFDLCYKAQNRCWSDTIKAYGPDCWDYPDPRCEHAPKMKNQLGYKITSVRNRQESPPTQPSPI